MNLLLDTHVWIWWRSEPERLRPKVLGLIESGESRIFLSAASVWEIAIKSGLGRIRLPQPADLFFEERLLEDRIEELPVTRRHAVMTASLPAKHGDPFDRMLIAQARCEKLKLVTADRNILSYGSGTMSAI